MCVGDESVVTIITTTTARLALLRTRYNGLRIDRFGENGQI